MNDANPDAETDSESTDFDSDRTACPECGGDIYYEPRITHGNEYEPTGGHVCHDCTWSVIDPDNGHIQNRSQERSRQRPPACRVTTTLARQLNAYSFRYLECSENEARARHTRSNALPKNSPSTPSSVAA